MKILETERDPIKKVRTALGGGAKEPDAQLQETVRGIIADVRARGDDALLELGREYDSPELDELRVGEEELNAACASIKPELLEAIRAAKANIEAYHRKQLAESWIDFEEEFVYGQLVTPIESVGLYAPAFVAPLPSTVLMTAVPAAVAGVGRMVMCTPPQKNGKADPTMLVAARECGIGDVFKVGGAQAVAAMAFGTKTVPRVDKVCGPGSAFVNEAKRQLYGYVGIDKLAGPSDILVLADGTADPTYVAADMLSQAEHGTDSPCVLITNSRKLADAVIKELRKQTALLARKDCIEESLAELGVVVIARDMDECIDLANEFAPEHLEIATADPWEVLRRVRNAGTILLGHYSCVPLGDFGAGPNHTLPTGGTARFSSALGVDDFLKRSGLLSCTKQGFKKMAPMVLELAAAEGFDAHANAVRIRLEGQERRP